MPNAVTTQIDRGRVLLPDVPPVFDDELIAFGGADTYVEGTILARKAVDDAITPAAGGGNTGDGTVTAASVVAGTVVPIAGTYVLTCIEAVTNGGVFKLEDPNGSIVAGYLAMTPGAGASTVFEAGGMTFTITDGATDFAVDDTFDLPVVANGKMVAFATAGAGGAQRPLGVLTYDVVATGAGDVAARVLLAGKVNATRLVIDADGDASNVTAAILDQLRAAGIRSESVKQLAEQDVTAS